MRLPSLGNGVASLVEATENEIAVFWANQFTSRFRSNADRYK
jgi:hypothetical protein